MKEIKTVEEYKAIDGSTPSIIEFGLAEGCIPCKMTKENLLTFEENKTFDVEYYFCGNIDIIADLGYSSVPTVMVVTKNVKAELNDSSVSMDEDELSDWIKSHLE